MHRGGEKGAMMQSKQSEKYRLVTETIKKCRQIIEKEKGTPPW